MHAVVAWVEHLVMALAVAAFAHFGVALKDGACRDAPAAVQHVSELHSAQPRTIRRVPGPLAKSLRRV